MLSIITVCPPALLLFCNALTDRALKADPTNLDVLLSLGVSHTNELDSGEALTYLSRWLHSHPQHRATAEMAGGWPGGAQVSFQHLAAVCSL